MLDHYDERPVIVALAGPDGAGKTTFYEAHLRRAGLRFIDPDALARELGIDAARAAEVAGLLRDDLVAQQESFVFETTLSDAAQHRVAFLQNAAARGYVVVLCFIGVDSVAIAEARVSMRMLAGGVDVPSDKLSARYAHTLANLEEGLRTLPFVEVYDNSVSGAPPRQIARLEQGRICHLGLPLPNWFADRFAELLALPEEYAIEHIEVIGQHERHTLRSHDGQHVLTITQPAQPRRRSAVSDRVHLALEDGAMQVQPVD